MLRELRGDSLCDTPVCRTILALKYFRTQCYFEDLKAGDVADISVLVFRGGNGNLDVELMVREAKAC